MREMITPKGSSPPERAPTEKYAGGVESGQLRVGGLGHPGRLQRGQPIVTRRPQRFSRWRSAFANLRISACSRTFEASVVPARPGSSRLIPARVDPLGVHVAVQTASDGCDVRQVLTPRPRAHPRGCLLVLDRPPSRTEGRGEPRRGNVWLGQSFVELLPRHVEVHSHLLRPGGLHHLGVR